MLIMFQRMQAFEPYVVGPENIAEESTIDTIRLYKRRTNDMRGDDSELHSTVMEISRYIMVRPRMNGSACTSAIHKPSLRSIASVYPDS